MLTGKNILLGVCGGIAVYKAVDIASRLRKAGANVDVIMTKSATKFVTPLTFQEITGNPISCDMWEKVHTWNVEHIALAQKADLILIAPATANMVGKLANGIADDMLSTTVLASLAPVFLAPAMNTNMYNNPIFQRNLQTLRQVANYNIITPAEGHLACGTSGIGRLPEPADIVRTVENYFTPVQQDFKNVKILITAGGTREPIDPVRYIGNRSSGKMGYAIAEAAAKRGAAVTLISGVTTLTASAGIKVIKVETAKEMQQHVEANFASNDVIVMAAAVADYAVAEVSEQKIKKASEKLSLELVKNPDILLGLGQKKQQNQLLIGFAAETQNLLKYAQDKLQRKNLDMIIANDVSKVNAGFNVDTNIVKIIGKNNLVEDIPLIKKTALASIILDKINKLKTH
ncbi:bifunctional phosphopantothenoylcysteine decarboxylase/phosphopantothenate--cysteine ligase CoaBC [Pectinatus brassicae]|uniref:Coenzyme A biosynthesis bifunctional protein CoaBC n=1 Tax=Pectinatus brassicae TaxID=862415 RepID=A0A840UTA8_9FIRM|nr:bifunctional phosphopantothenoylcysteine decarboxylase/phosphopantothenate--cysteine ligase CoaBC [Pectinatus brassicae]MBB5336054.1 phosphopantothenoylcysteine decarboxylase/phosphopantothenate--cysteine ligase [Pectinatus brassicae]